jgi:hypothetical protein
MSAAVITKTEVGASDSRSERLDTEVISMLLSSSRLSVDSDGSGAAWAHAAAMPQATKVD